MRDFECHITIEALFGEHSYIESIARKHQWKSSFISGDPDLGNGDRFFLTKHFDELEYAQASTDIMAWAIETSLAKAKVVRKKIEEVLLDTKNNTWKEKK